MLRFFEAMPYSRRVVATNAPDQYSQKGVVFIQVSWVLLHYNTSKD
jgi:hypothetical protein